MRSLLLGLAMALGASGGADQPPAPAPAQLQRAPDGHPDLSGRWALDPERSDRPGDRFRERMGGHRGGGPAGGGGRPPGGSHPGGGPPPGGPGGPDGPEGGPRPPAELLTIEQRGEEIAIDDDSGLVRRLHSDGRKAKTDNGLTEVRSRWEGDTLVCETRRERGAKQKTSYALNADGSQLLITTRVEPPGREAFDVRLVYVRESAPAP